MKKYTADWFIKFFSNIPKDKWCTEHYTDPNNHSKHCALGHCEATKFIMTRKAKALGSLFGDYCNVTKINDGNNYKYKQLHPRTRIINALKRVKKGLSV